MSATSRVLTGLAAGALIGLLLAGWDETVALQVANVAQPIGKLWLNALQMTVVPLVLALVVVGVNTATDAAASGRIARRAIVVFIVVLTGGALFAALAAPLVFALFPHNPALITALDHASVPAAAQAAPNWIDTLVAIVPNNAVMAAAQSAMLPLVVFALFLGFALTRIAPARRALLMEFFQAISDTMIVIVRWVLWIAPLGVFALILSVCARSGLGMLSALGVYVLVECLLYLAVTVMLLPLAVVFGGEKLRRFALALVPAQVVAVSTQSSLASLPAMLESADRRLGYPQQVAALVLPMAVSLFRLTSPVQYVTSAVFIAWAYGIDLSTAQLLAGALLAVVISLGSVGLPGQVTFIATNLPVAQAMGLPLSPLGLMLAVDTLPDALATLGNVTGDLTATSVVTRQSRRDTA
ncbi:MULTISPECIES: dicarboxylate/amino acid:cation symporter [Rhodanobacter]|uniref:dicarboxylate/amino acid:cation symporter n=1 Tax=Rhodanobacter TaxID=75309 RepID=UPI000260CC47|nr:MULTISPECIES: dicarboxylate/amino acid:cation symporter [Rhodanobacter]EIM03669.1 sodium:dicarboxylate symporter [Rhodanobacter denitrificans]UJJ50562.1 dicarboxylate/amino acid:cation symporter [Rhodanobacter denitrificans]UJM91114.1 dicarboxylate/amino acid:cation symporter [Rhodanobacter denitrificans]UJM93278.1 dicarboxylate/amino acid:cation symporter [Rhodanobacter denitrificans]UJM96810.1 dicarboxylate/amino acid:cation symporter [Rhodanobacter denitrificans]